jgi:hypothetical protein
LTAGWPTVRKAQLPSGRGMTQKRMPMAEMATGNREPCAGTSAGGFCITGRIRADARPERELTGSGEPVETR